MKRTELKNTLNRERHDYRTTGLALIAAGLVFVIDRFLQTGWLSLFVLPVLGALGIYYGIIIRRLAWAIPGALVSGLGWGGFFLLSDLVDLSSNVRLGLLFASLGVGFLAIFVVSKLVDTAPAYWALLPGITLASIGGPFLIDKVTIFVFEIFVLTGVGIALWAWGSLQKLIGLIIPGCLLIGIGPGIFMAWSRSGDINGLTETGVMLVWFALGWGLITIAARVTTQRFIWWPLIPGGLLAVVGWGLYIGGDPGNALSFIGNTGSIGLIIFGIYLILLRRGFKG